MLVHTLKSIPFCIKFSEPDFISSLFSLFQKTLWAAAENVRGGQETKTIWGAETEAEAAEQCQTQGELFAVYCIVL